MHPPRTEAELTAERDRVRDEAMEAMLREVAQHTERERQLLAEIEALRRVANVRDPDAAETMRVAYERFAPKPIPNGATAEERARIAQENALNQKVLNTLGKWRGELRQKREKIPASGKAVVLDALKNHLKLPLWMRAGANMMRAAVGGLAGYGGVSALGALGVLGSIAVPFTALAAGAAAGGAAFASRWYKYSKENEIGRGRSILHKSPFVSATAVGLVTGATAGFLASPPGKQLREGLMTQLGVSAGGFGAFLRRLMLLRVTP